MLAAALPFRVLPFSSKSQHRLLQLRLQLNPQAAWTELLLYRDKGNAGIPSRSKLRASGDTPR
jgi:hypothetical protein